MKGTAAARDRRRTIAPLTPSRWGDLERLLDRPGPHHGCWCLWWRILHKEFGSTSGEAHRRRMRRIVAAGEKPGLLGYENGEPVAWVSLGPREDFAALEASRVFRRVDDKPVWSVVCFVVHPDHRRRGWMRRLLRAAADYAAEHGATLLEGYPVECGGRRLTGDGGYTGVASTFRAQGFREVARPRPERPILRRRLRRRAGKER
jgi:GNAT superfamily N-acetyltransferase